MATTAEQSTDLTVMKPGGFTALNHASTETREIIEELCCGQELTERHLPRAKNPSGGATSWQVPTLGGMETITEITGIIVAARIVRAMFRQKDENGNKISLGSEPPLCSAVGADRLAIGVGDPGGPCVTCPNNAWGSTENGRGKACQESELWFFLQSEGFMPLVVKMSPTSLENAQNYRMGTLGRAGVRMSSVVTSVTLTPASNSQGDFAIAVPRMVGMLDPDEGEAAREYGKQFATAFNAITAENLDTEA